MSELLDKQVNVQRKFEKNFWGSRKLGTNSLVNGQIGWERMVPRA